MSAPTRRATATETAVVLALCLATMAGLAWTVQDTYGVDTQSTATPNR